MAEIKATFTIDTEDRKALCRLYHLARAKKPDQISSDDPENVFEHHSNGTFGIKPIRLLRPENVVHILPPHGIFINPNGAYNLLEVYIDGEPVPGFITRQLLKDLDLLGRFIAVTVKG